VRCGIGATTRTHELGAYPESVGTSPHEERVVSADPYLVLDEADYRVLGPSDFGAPGLRAVESIGPFVAIQASGPLITVHDSTIEPHKGIGHHPHRYNERLFYILAGQLDHDDALNGIRGHMPEGAIARLTEGRRGMLHSEINHGDVPTHAFILVYATDPVPETASFAALADAEAPRYEEGEGTRTKELVGSRSPLRIHGDIRLFADTTLGAGRELEVALADGEGGLLWIHDGRLRVDGRDLGRSATLLVPPSDGTRRLTLRALEPTRLLRVIHGPGFGLIRRDGTGSGS
jgi:redox-sensitive bicupin YhaK (pirin superfamily)